MKRYQASYEKRRAITNGQANRIAYLVSEGWTVTAAGREIGVSQQRASQIWVAIKASLGPQAC